MTTPDYGMTDHVARTRGTLVRCVAARQWQNVAAIGGFKSEHDARVAYDPRYADVFKAHEPVCAPEPAEPLSVKQAMKLQAPAKPRDRDDIAWVADIRSRMDTVDVTAQQLSLFMNFDKMYVTNFLAPKAQRWPAGRMRIEAAIGHFERMSAAQTGEAAA